MPYLTTDEYLERLIDDTETAHLTDPAGTDPDVDKIETAIAAAGNFADTYLAARYVVPIDPAPDALKDIVFDLARERLFTNIPVEEVTARADRARGLLRDISKGVADLIAGGEQVEEGSADIPVVSAPDTVFSNGVLGAYQGRMRTLQ